MHAVRRGVVTMRLYRLQTRDTQSVMEAERIKPGSLLLPANGDCPNGRLLA